MSEPSLKASPHKTLHRDRPEQVGGVDCRNASWLSCEVRVFIRFCTTLPVVQRGLLISTKSVADHRAPKFDVEPFFDDNRRSETKVLKVPDIKFAIFALDNRNLFNQIGSFSDLITTWSIVSTGSGFTVGLVLGALEFKGHEGASSGGRSGTIKRLDAKLSDMSWSTS